MVDLIENIVKPSENQIFFDANIRQILDNYKEIAD